LGPAGAIRIRLVYSEDGRAPRDRLYDLQTLDIDGRWRPMTGILGSELADLARWWKAEAGRRGR